MRRPLHPLVLLAVLALTACAPELPVNDGRVQAPAPAGSHTSEASPVPEGQGSATPSASPSPESVNACLAQAEALPVGDQVGQLFMVGVSTSGLDETTRTAIVNNKLGSVVLLGNTTAGAQPIRMLSAELGSLGTAELPLLVSVDQEGGQVQRLQGEGFTRIPDARKQGAWPEGQLTEEATKWAEELRSAGVAYNLAPDADVVPEDRRNTNAPVGKLKRDFGSEPGLVGAKAMEFIEGMHSENVVTSVKHFPGLGLVETNTDFGAAEDSEVAKDSPVLDPFRTVIEGGVDSVMVSSAVYTQIDPENEAMFSSAIIDGMLRGDLGFDRVVISDDLGAAKSVEDIEPADRGVRFIEAGGDLAINADPTIMTAMVEATVAKAESDEAFAARVTESAARVLTLKESAGLMECGG